MLRMNFLGQRRYGSRPGNRATCVTEGRLPQNDHREMFFEERADRSQLERQRIAPIQILVNLPADWNPFMRPDSSEL